MGNGEFAINIHHSQFTIHLLNLHTTVDAGISPSAGRFSAENKPEDLPDQKQHSMLSGEKLKCKSLRHLYFNFISEAVTQKTLL